MFIEATSPTPPFFQIHLGEALVILGLILTWLQYRLDRSKTTAERKEEERKALETQIQMHSENKQRLDALAEFHRAQLLINERWDTQIEQLKLQTTSLTEIAKATNRRLEMLEDKDRG